MKYLVVKERGCDVAILFDELLDHVDVARGREVVAAGFCQVKGIESSTGGIPDDTYCFGRSVSLGIGRSNEDTAIVERALRNRL